MRLLIANLHITHPATHACLTYLSVGFHSVTCFQRLCCSPLQVLVLSTRLLRPTDIPELLFTTQRLLPDIGI